MVRMSKTLFNIGDLPTVLVLMAATDEKLYIYAFSHPPPPPVRRIYFTTIIILNDVCSVFVGLGRDAPGRRFCRRQRRRVIRANGTRARSLWGGWCEKRSCHTWSERTYVLACASYTTIHLTLPFLLHEHVRFFGIHLFGNISRTNLTYFFCYCSRAYIYFCYSCYTGHDPVHGPTCEF